MNGDFLSDLISRFQELVAIVPGWSGPSSSPSPPRFPSSKGRCPR